MKRPDRPLAPAAVFVLGFGASLAANLLWTWPGGPVRILGGAFASIALPAAIHLWPQVHAPERPVRVLRNVVMSLIAVLAAATTFWHASSLLVAHGEVTWLACAYPVMTELLVVFAVLAARAPSTAVAAAKAKRPAVAKSATRTAAPPIPVPSELASRRGALQERAEWLRGQPSMGWSEQVRAVEEKFSVSRSTAKRVVSELAS